MKNWIVVVDDDALSLTSARTMLAAEDMKVSCLPSGKGLLKFMEKNDPDLILLDVMMPEFDGFETLAALREQQKARSKPETPVIFLTGDSDHESEQQGLKLGAADYIHKPFNKDILISRIRNTINNSKKIVSLTEHATKDKLTGLFNKAEGISRIRETLHNSPGALLMLDMDSFKLVNDLFGHEKGDQILKGFADLSKFNTREDDILCRIGGDEFLFFCGGLNGEQAVSALTDRLNQQLEDLAIQLLGENHGIPLGISVGAVMAPEYGTDYDVLFNLADEAMYRTKKNGKHGCTLYVDSDVSFDSVQDPNEELVRITKILEERNQGREALVLGTDVFSAVFQFVDRFNSSHDGKALLLLFILEPIDNPEEHVLFEASTCFGDVLKHNLGKSDIILHNKNNQFFVLLPMMQEPDIEGITNKILSAWREMPVSAHFETKTASQIR